MRRVSGVDRTGLDRGARARLDLHLRALDVGLWDYDIDADVLNCDIRWCEIMRIAEGTARRIADLRPFLHPEDVGPATVIDLDAVVGMIARDEHYHIDFRVVHPDGPIRWIRSVACLLVDTETGHRRAVGCVTDITDVRADTAATDDVALESNDGEDQADDSGLTEKELECLGWVSLGKTAWETAVITGRSQRTIEFHLTNAVRKLDATNKVHAAVTAIRRGLI